MAKKSGVRERLDVRMVSLGLAESREQAKRLILAGAVEIDGVNLPKPGQLIDDGTEIRLKQKERYVSRGGLKLEEALQIFDIKLTGLVCADIGASTGGFTDCMLQHGASKVYAVDVGATQMHERVRNDSRVLLLEHTNARDLKPDMFEVAPSFAAVDVSFISILRVSGPLREILAAGGEAVLLIKPQFEAGREAVSKGRGVIRDPEVHKAVIRSVLDGLLQQGWYIRDLIPSPIAGGSGNIEFLFHCFKAADSQPIEVNPHIDIDELIRSAGAKLQ